MYIPNLNQMADKTEIIDFMKRFSFAVIITANDNIPQGTHLPFLVSVRDEKIILTSHFAKANDQWKGIEDKKILVIFTEPHSYISPSLYEKEINVPTWNYIAVHAYGNVKLISETEKVVDVLENTIDNYEKAFREQWNRLPHDYKFSLIKGIVAFEIEVTDLQAKKKLSQNKTNAEKQNIINSLSKSHDGNEKLIADYMRKEM